MKKNYIFAIITVFIWSTLAATAKLVLNDIPNLQVLAISSLFSFIFLLILNVCTGQLKEMKKYTIKQYGIMAGLGFIGLFLYSALYYYGISNLSSQEACILNYLWPIMLVLFSCIILKEKLTFGKLIALICSFLGIIVMSLGRISFSGNNIITGILACIIAAACYGLFSVLNKKADYNQNITMMIIWFTVSVCSFALGSFTENWVPVKGSSWLGLIWLGVVVNAIAYLLWAIALKGSSNTAKIANLAYLTPFLSLIVSWLLVKETISIQATIALVFIIGGILLQNINIKKSRKDS